MEIENILEKIEELQIKEGRFKLEILRDLSRLYGEDEYFLEKAMQTEKSQKGKCYTFFKNEDEDNFLQKYSWCQRPHSDNMSLHKFTKNGEMWAYMSESLAEEHGLKQVDLNEFMFMFVQPIVKENLYLKELLKGEGK